MIREQVDPRRHFIVQGVTEMNQDRWVEQAKNGVEALVFVHGFNTSFDDSLYRMAQIVWDLQYDGTAVLYSWPSQGEVLAYSYDQNSALIARAGFDQVISLLEDAEIARVHVLAHSMGNLVALEALANRAPSRKSLGLAEVIMAAPDVDQDHYRQLMARVQKITSGATLYASSADKPMMISRRFAMAPRAGDVFENCPVLVDGVEAIDVTAVGNELFGLNHNTFAGTRSLINDIKLLLGTGLRPPHKRLAEIRTVPEGAAQPLFWRYVP
jgi:esterase/lipase superfamily enzyme